MSNVNSTEKSPSQSDARRTAVTSHVNPKEMEWKRVTWMQYITTMNGYCHVRHREDNASIDRNVRIIEKGVSPFKRT